MILKTKQPNAFEDISYLENEQKHRELICQPTILIDKEKCLTNMDRMIHLCKKHNIVFRPHFKTHQSKTIGQWFRDKGVQQITVSSVEMALYFVEQGWKDISIAFPFNVLEIEKLKAIPSDVQIHILIQKVEVAHRLIKELESSVNFLIEIDLGDHRGGLIQEEYDVIDAILSATQKSDLLNFGGFLAHAGHSYACRGRKEILQVHQIAIKQFEAIKSRFPNPRLVFSYGDTPSSSIAQDFGPVNELRPGNFIFYDLMQAQIGACGFEDIAMVLACPVVDIQRSRNEMVLYGGAVHLSKEQLLHDEYGVIYGLMVQKNAGAWSHPIEGAYLRKISQEHGILKLPEALMDNYEIGDLVYLLPVHSCLCMDLHSSAYTLDGESLAIKS